jgi:hypothetical protein
MICPERAGPRSLCGPLAGCPEPAALFWSPSASTAGWLPTLPEAANSRQLLPAGDGTRGGGVAVWRCGGVAVWRCGGGRSALLGPAWP